MRGAERGRPALPAVVVPVCAALLLAGCGSVVGPRAGGATNDGSTAGGATNDGSTAGATTADGLTGVLAQNREDEVRGVVSVRLTATAGPVTVRRLALDWPALAPARSTSPDYPLAVGVPTDLPVPYGPARCGSPPDPGALLPDDPPVAVVTLDDGAGGETTSRVTLVPDGDLPLRLFTTSCRRQAVAAAVDVGFGPTWSTSRRGDGRAALRGELRLARRGGAQQVTVAAVDGSVLLSLRPVTDVTPPDPLLAMAPTVAAAALPVVVASSGRCDGHALGESKKTYVFTVTVDTGSGPTAIDVSPTDPAARAAMWRVVTATCGVT